MTLSWPALLIALWITWSIGFLCGALYVAYMRGDR